ncbi:MAG: hypothetical protein MK171_12390 [Pirellulales bacterium]|nr:hypothetical protein [Pirellulales bacterium]
MLLATQKLIEEIFHFQQGMFDTEKGLLERLLQSQQPKSLSITCSASQIKSIKTLAFPLIVPKDRPARILGRINLATGNGSATTCFATSLKECDIGRRGGPVH